MGSRNFPQFFGAKLEHQNPHMSPVDLYIFFCGETAEKLLWSKEARAASGMMRVFLRLHPEKPSKSLEFRGNAKAQYQVEAWLKSRKFSFPNADEYLVSDG